LRDSAIETPAVKIPVNLQPLLPSRPLSVPTLLQQLQVGQVLQGRVTGEVQPGLLRLQIATTELLARTPLQVAAGTRLQLEVVRPAPLPELRILREATLAERTAQLVRSALGRQYTPREVRESLDKLQQQPLSGRTAELARELRSVIQQQGVRLERLDANQVRQAVARSGIWHEARLSLATSAASTATAAAPDAKLQLLQLFAVLNAEPGQKKRSGNRVEAVGEGTPRGAQTGGDSLLSRLARLLEGAVARVQLQQSAALPGDEGPRQAWQLDLPIRLPEETGDAMLRIEREGSTGGDGDEPTWAVNLVFEFDTIGRLQSRISLAGDRVSATFWCDRAPTLERLERLLPDLHKALLAQGLEVVHLGGVHGEPPQPLITVPRPDGLLDERA
jgi:hypothetical protein